MRIKGSNAFTEEQFTLTSQGIYVAEISELGLRKAPSSIVIGRIPFGFYKSDTNNGELTGWRYMERNGTRQVLIIND